MAQPPPRRRIAPIPVVPTSNPFGTAFGSSLLTSSARRPVPSAGPEAADPKLPGRRLYWDLSKNSNVTWKALLKGNGLEKKKKKRPVPDEDSSLDVAEPGPSRAVGPLALAIQRLEREAAAAGTGQERVGSDSSGSDVSRGEDDENATQSSGSDDDDDSDEDEDCGREVVLERLGYDEDFIDDSDTIRLRADRALKTKHTGFYINQGAIEFEEPEVVPPVRRRRAPARPPTMAAAVALAAAADKAGGSALNSSHADAGTTAKPPATKAAAKRALQTGDGAPTQAAAKRARTQQAKGKQAGQAAQAAAGAGEEASGKPQLGQSGAEPVAAKGQGAGGSEESKPRAPRQRVGPLDKLVRTPAAEQLQMCVECILQKAKTVTPEQGSAGVVAAVGAQLEALALTLHREFQLAPAKVAEVAAQLAPALYAGGTAGGTADVVALLTELVDKCKVRLGRLKATFRDVVGKEAAARAAAGSQEEHPESTPPEVSSSLETKLMETKLMALLKLSLQLYGPTQERAVLEELAAAWPPQAAMSADKLEAVVASKRPIGRQPKGAAAATALSAAAAGPRPAPPPPPAIAPAAVSTVVTEAMTQAPRGAPSPLPPPAALARQLSAASPMAQPARIQPPPEPQTVAPSPTPSLQQQHPASQVSQLGTSQPQSSSQPLAQVGAPTALASGGSGGGGLGVGVVATVAVDEAQQMAEALAVAGRHGADRQLLLADADAYKLGRVNRTIFKALCWAGPQGFKISDIITHVNQRGYDKWDKDKKYSTVRQALQKVCEADAAHRVFVHVGDNRYALRALPDAVHQPKVPQLPRAAASTATATAGAGRSSQPSASIVRTTSGQAASGSALQALGAAAGGTQGPASGSGVPQAGAATTLADALRVLGTHSAAAGRAL